MLNSASTPNCSKPHESFDSMESFLAAFMPHAGEFQADIKNYTDIMPQIQFNQILIEKLPLP